MLTIRKIRVPSEDWACARRAADYVIDAKSSPGALPDAAAEPSRGPTTVWVGSESLLSRLGVEPGEAVAPTGFGRVLQGRHATSGERVRTEGMIHRPLTDERGKAVLDEDGRQKVERLKGTKSVDLTFSAPKSVSVLWCQAEPELKAEIEAAMLVAAEAMLAEMTERKPVVAFQRALEPATGFAAVSALHVVARAARGERVPWPQLHVHGVVVGVGRSDGFFASPELSGMFKYGAPLEGGAVARARLAESLVGLGFEIEREGRFFEVKGVPRPLVKQMSGRAREVAAVVAAREAERGRRLTDRERAVIAMQTREPKSGEAPLAESVATWDEVAATAGFDPGAAARLRNGGGFHGGVERRRAAVAAAIRAGGAEDLSPGERRALAYECAAGTLTLAEAEALAEAVPSSQS